METQIVSENLERRHEKWHDVPNELWTDPKWQMRNRLGTYEELAEIVNLTDSEIEALKGNVSFRVDVTPYFASLIDPNDPNCPVRQQVIPTMKENSVFAAREDDSTSEEKNSPVRSIVHKYDDKLILLLTTECASYCRYCTRSRMVGDGSKNYSSKDHQDAIDYIANTPTVRDVLLTGGDPLALPLGRIEGIISQLSKIPHVEIIRIGTRAPVFNPFIITNEFAAMLEKYHPVWLNIHVNHPKEITPELAEACNKLNKAGVPLGNQTVLLKNVNDTVEIQKQLCHDLIKIRVRPYYLYQCDTVRGAGHFITPLGKGIEIMEGLLGHTTGFAVPKYIIDSPNGGGKIPVMPNYVLSQSENRIVLRNYKGKISVYEVPTNMAGESMYSREEKEDVTVLNLLTDNDIPKGY